DVPTTACGTAPPRGSATPSPSDGCAPGTGEPAESVFFLYDALVGFVVAVFLRPVTRLRGSAELRERLGDAPVPSAARPRIVLHAVSAGEMSAAGAIVEALERVLPSAAVHL